MSGLEARRAGRVLHLTLAREEKRNALTGALCKDLVEAIEGAEQDRGIGAVLLDAKGPVFCAGMDLAEATSAGAADATAVHERLFTLGLRVSVPIVMAVGGPALGGGVGLVANGHVVLAAQGATFALSEVRIGMWPFVISQALKTAVGERRALALSLTGRVFSVTEARDYGLVHEIAPAVELDERAQATAAHLASLSPEAVRAGLRFTHDARALGHEDALRLALDRRAAAFASPDFAEGVLALREKRKPEWPSLAG